MIVKKIWLFKTCSFLAVLLVTRASQQNTESTPNADSNSEYIPHEERGTHENEPDGGLETGNVQVTSAIEPNVDVNTPVQEDPEPENIPESEDNSESDIDDQPSPEDKPGSTEDEGHEEWDDSYPEGAQEPQDLNPEDNPIVENGFLHLPFNDFDGPVPNDFFIPVDERSEPQEPNLEPENVPEYWWENEPEVFYDDEYAYINSLPEYDREAESYRTRGEAEAEYETEPENEAETDGKVEPEFEYISYLKESKKFGTQKILKVLIAVLSVVCGSLGAVIIVLTYIGFRHYKEAELEETVEYKKDGSKTGEWEKASDVFQKHLGSATSEPILTSYKKM